TCNLSQYKKMTDCEILSLLADTTSWRKAIPTHDCLIYLIRKLTRDSNIYPNWVCNFGGCDYLSYSMNKSLFKSDLIRWMFFFKCNGVDKLKETTKGNFNPEEIERIKETEREGEKIDTTILY